MARPAKNSNTKNNKIINQKFEAINVAMAQIEKQYGKGSIMRFGDGGKAIQVEIIPTGSIALDLALGIGGLPRGRITEIYGPEASGKTTLCLHVIAEAQKKAVRLPLLTLNTLLMQFGPKVLA